MRLLPTIIAALAATSFLAGCGGDKVATEPAGAPGVNSTSAATGAATEPAAPSADVSNPCTLLTEAEVTKIIGSVPAPVPKSYGAGFSECLWKGANNTTIRLSVMPSSDLEEDYIAKLNKIGTAPALGEKGTVFPGVLGIGHASAGGASVGFISGPHGILLAVRSGADQSTDQSHATLLGAALRKRL